ncbi:hypothetical protein ASG49_00920 [Marmoricola sp. Leaf446]|uniref:hypothetical protein n=1 Tax=Marmoricola sp. Leaf446 TaxID=1736379 RepID=UPI0006F48B62|nr:hypothetical protein [Marmoricola sp. Leaf446]KQT93598.1 hypothetical protein ASG49_00920 [Marmoricola sp. Leaf446]
MLTVFVLVEDDHGLVETIRALDLQTLGRADHRVVLVPTSTDDTLLARLQLLERRRPHVTLAGRSSTVGGAMLEAMQAHAADVVVPVRLGTRLMPEALARLAAAPTGHAVVGRRSGTDSFLPAPGPLTDLVPWAVVAVSGARAVAAAEAAADAADAGAWVARWQRAVLDADADADAQQLVDRPMARGEQLARESLVEVPDSRLAWDGARITLEVHLGGLTDLDEATFFVHAADSGEEHPFPAAVTQRDQHVVLEGALDLSSVSGVELPDGEWLVGFDVRSGGWRGRGRVPNTEIEPGLVRGRPVLRSLRRRYLALQVGAVKRNFIDADPRSAEIVESVRGTRLRLPLRHLHVAETEAVSGQLLLGGLAVAAEIVSTPGGARLEAWLSGLAGTYDLGARFGHRRPVPTGLTLEVDGVGRMRLVATPPPSASAPAAVLSRAQQVRARLRSALPGPVKRAVRHAVGARRARA